MADPGDLNQLEQLWKWATGRLAQFAAPAAIDQMNQE